MRKTLRSIALFFLGRRTLKRRGSGILNMIKSDEMLKTALVMRWFVAAEHCSTLVSTRWRRLDVQHTGVCRDGPVLVEWPTPNGEVQQLHNNLGRGLEKIIIMKCGTYKGYSDIYGCAYDNSTLWKNKCHSSVHDEKAGLDEPYGQYLHLFHNQDELGAIDASLYLFIGELVNVLPWFDQIAACTYDSMHNRNENGVGGLVHISHW
jgi:hypothetical protein